MGLGCASTDVAFMRLKTLPMASRIFATFLSLTPGVASWGQAIPATSITATSITGTSITASHENGRTVYENEPATRTRTPTRTPARTAARRGDAAKGARDFDELIERASERHQVDAGLVRSVIKVESNFNPAAVSPKGAMGLMQLMPATARRLSVANPFDPEQNVDGGVRHLKRLLENYGGDLSLSLAAYNAGEGAVARSGGVPRYAETQSYVQRIRSLTHSGGFAGKLVGGLASRGAPILVKRDERGVLHLSNTD